MASRQAQLRSEPRTVHVASDYWAVLPLQVRATVQPAAPRVKNTIRMGAFLLPVRAVVLVPCHSLQERKSRPAVVSFQRKVFLTLPPH